MTTAKTMFQIAGAPPAKPGALDNAVLILIDMQDEYLPSGAVPLTGVNEALEQGSILLERARKAGTPVVHVVHHGPAGHGFFDPEGKGGQINEKVKPIGDEPIISKSLVSAWVDSKMLEEVKKTGRKELIVIGFMTHMCVSTYVRAAVEQYGYKCTVVAECTATRDLPSQTEDGKVVSAESVQQSSLAAIADLFALVVKSVDDIPDSSQ